MQQTTSNVRIHDYSYNTADRINEGFNSEIFTGQNDITQEAVVVKVFDLSKLHNEVEKSLLHQEIAALSILHSKNIVRLHHSFISQHYAYIITEYCNQGDLLKHLKRPLPEAEVIQLIRQIIEGFKEQISKGIIHRDLKPKNILLHDGVPKIADYGFSKMINGPKEKYYYNVGTTLYMSPQTIMQNTYSEKSDIWSLGITFYQMLFGRVPWQATNEKDFVKIVLSQRLTFPEHIQVSANMKNFIAKCLSLDEDQRMTISEMETHPIFAQKVNTLFALRERNGPLIKSVHYSRGQTQYTKIHASIDLKHNVSQSPRARVVFNNTLNVNVKNQFIQQNDRVIQNILNLLKFLLRCAQIIDYFEMFTTKLLENKLLFFILKHGLFKARQLKSLIEHQFNTLGMLNFQQYIANGSYLQFKIETNTHYDKFKSTFQKWWLRMERRPQNLQLIMQDSKFAILFDKSELEVISFYIFMGPVIREAALELQRKIAVNIAQYADNQSLSSFDEASIILLGYLITYISISKLAVTHFENVTIFAEKSQFPAVTAGKPKNITKQTFYKIASRMSELY